MIKSSGKKSVRELFAKKEAGNDEQLYVIPPYQRAYTWAKKEWNYLFDDLLSNNEGYFLGSLICISNDGCANQVIDGQQRLTTLSILLLAIHDKITPLQKELGINAEDHEDITTDLLWLKSAIFINKIKQKRLTPSIQNDNSLDWEYLVNAKFNSSNAIKPKNLGNRRIEKAYEFFKELIEASIFAETQDNNKKFADLYEFLQKVMSANLIKIETDNEQSAFLLFESLNNRGIPLSPIDLIKNKLLSKLSGNIEQNNEKWQILVNNLGDVPNLQERFLRHYYMTYHHTLPESAQSNNNARFIITKSNLINAYATQIDSNAQFIFDELIEKSNIYGLFINPENIDSESNLAIYKDNLIRLKHLGISSAYVVVLYVFDKYTEHDFSTLLDYLEYWFICRHVTNYPATNMLDNIFSDILLSQLNQYNEFVILQELKLYLNKERVESALEDCDIYNGNKSVARALLIYLESKKRNKQTEVNFWKTSDKGKWVWTIEHIYPQKPKNNTDWGDENQINALNERLNSLGNLTLTCYNSSYSNKKYAEKCQIVDDGNEVGLRNGDIKINVMLPTPNESENAWTTKEIDSRTKQLISIFLENFEV